MSMLGRYRKSGGFLQLLKLIETTGKKKQENFLNIIEAEDPKWAEALKEKMLTVDKILGWNDDITAEIFSRTQHVTLATALHQLPADAWDRIGKTFSHSQRRTIEDLKAEKEPNPAEISAAYLKILEQVRTMINDGELHPEKFAPELVIPDGYEEKLGKNMGIASNADAGGDAAPGIPNMDGFTAPPPTAAGGASSKDVNTLRQKVHSLQQQNQVLKKELQITKDKLAQIKRIA